MHHELKINDHFKMQDKPGTAEMTVKPPVMTEFEVTAETGLFKNGKQYSKGEKILLTEKAAANFLAAGEIKTI
jgi:hypothetical protein